MASALFFSWYNGGMAGPSLEAAKIALETTGHLPPSVAVTDEVEKSLAERLEGYAGLSPEEKYRVRLKEHDKGLVLRSTHLENKALDLIALKLPHADLRGGVQALDTLVKTRRLLAGQSTENVAINAPIVGMTFVFEGHKEEEVSRLDNDEVVGGNEPDPTPSV